jgi:hypothetical protein
MQIDWDSADKIFHLAVGVGAVGAAWVGMLIKSSLQRIALTQAENKAELVEHQNEIKADLNFKHAQNSQSIAVHQAEDKAIFDGISRTLKRMDDKLDRQDAKLDEIRSGR